MMCLCVLGDVGRSDNTLCPSSLLHLLSVPSPLCMQHGRRVGVQKRWGMQTHCLHPPSPLAVWPLPVCTPLVPPLLNT